MTVDQGMTADGTEQLRRRWTVADPIGAILVVHGVSEHSGRYLHVGQFFAERGFDVASFDNRGFGESGGRRGHIDRFEQFADDIADRLAERRELGVPVILYGHSLGGLMATDYLTSSRPQPDLAVLSAPALGSNSPQWQRLLAPVAGRLTPKLFFSADIDGTGLSRDPEVAEAFAGDPLLVAGATARFGLETFAAMRRVSGQLDQIQVPTYVLHGDEDEVVPIEASRPLADLDLVTYREWTGLQHECHNEPEQDQVMGEIEAWLRKELAKRDG